MSQKLKTHYRSYSKVVSALEKDFDILLIMNYESCSDQ